MIVAAIILWVDKQFFQRLQVIKSALKEKNNFIDININTITQYDFVRRGVSVNCQTSLRVPQIRLFETLFMELVVPILVQGVPRHWTPGNLAKSQAHIFSQKGSLL